MPKSNITAMEVALKIDEFISKPQVFDAQAQNKYQFYLPETRRFLGNVVFAFLKDQVQQYDDDQIIFYYNKSYTKCTIIFRKIIDDSDDVFTRIRIQPIIAYCTDNLFLSNIQSLFEQFKFRAKICKIPKTNIANTNFYR